MTLLVDFSRDFLVFNLVFPKPVKWSRRASVNSGPRAERRLCRFFVRIRDMQNVEAIFQASGTQVMPDS